MKTSVSPPNSSDRAPIKVICPVPERISAVAETSVPAPIASIKIDPDPCADTAIPSSPALPSTSIAPSLRKISPPSLRSTIDPFSPSVRISACASSRTSAVDPSGFTRFTIAATSATVTDLRSKMLISPACERAVRIATSVSIGFGPEPTPIGTKMPMSANAKSRAPRASMFTPPFPLSRIEASCEITETFPPVRKLPNKISAGAINRMSPSSAEKTLSPSIEIKPVRATTSMVPSEPVRISAPAPNPARIALVTEIFPDPEPIPASAKISVNAPIVSNKTFPAPCALTARFPLVVAPAVKRSDPFVKRSTIDPSPLTVATSDCAPSTTAATVPSAETFLTVTVTSPTTKSPLSRTWIPPAPPLAVKTLTLVSIAFAPAPSVPTPTPAFISNPFALTSTRVSPLSKIDPPAMIATFPPVLIPPSKTSPPATTRIPPDTLLNRLASSIATEPATAST